MPSLKLKMGKILWWFFKDYCYITSGKDLMNLTPWFKVSIFGEKVADINYTTHEIMNWGKKV